MVCFSGSALLYLSYQMTRLSGALFVKTEDRDKKLFRNLDSTTIFMQNHKLTGPQKVVEYYCLDECRMCNTKHVNLKPHS